MRGHELDGGSDVLGKKLETGCGIGGSGISGAARRKGWGSFGFERSFEVPVGIHVYFVSVLHNGNRLEISQIEAGKTNRDVGFAAGDAPVSVGVIVY